MIPEDFSQWIIPNLFAYELTIETTLAVSILPYIAVVLMVLW